MTSFRNRFGWSISREDKFDECRRCYYFHYYLSWGGWEKSAPAVVREAFKLKRLVSLALWRGQLVHYIASKFLQSLKIKDRIPVKEDVVNYTLERFDKQFDFSHRKKYLTTHKKRGDRLNVDWLALRKHEYNQTIDRQQLERVRKECLTAIDSLYEGPLLESIMDTNNGNWDIEDLDHAEFSKSFSYMGVDIYAKTDFTFLDKDGVFNIVDWKTHGKNSKTDKNDMKSKTELQLGVYGFYSSITHGIPPERINLLEVNLLDGGNVTEHRINSENLKLFSGHIERGISKLCAVLVDNDIERNEPLGRKHFPKIENGGCKYCNFYRICKERKSPILF